jgi:hypothetical protein
MMSSKSCRVSNAKTTTWKGSYGVGLRLSRSSRDPSPTVITANANADQKARLLEVKVAANSDTIDQLREERSILVKDYKELQRRFTDLSEVTISLRFSIIQLE